MQLIGILRLDALCAQHPECRGLVTAWRHEVEDADWTSLRQVRERYITATVAKDGTVVFRLLQGLYQLATLVRLDKGIVFVERAWSTASDQNAAPQGARH
jgi:mRNA-degrading endonuclease HigB of HigAB toxin-antitoxin module